MDENTEEQPARRRSRAWGRAVGLVGGGLLAGGILAGTLTANAATDDGTDEGTGSTPSVTQEDGSTTTTPPEDCPEGGRGGPGAVPSEGSTSGDADTAT